jgi:hypothetical protein
MNADEVRALLRERVVLAGNMTKWGAGAGIKPPMVSRILLGRDDPTPSVLRALGLRRVVTYERVEGGR